MHCADDVVQPAPLGNIFLCDFILRIYFIFMHMCLCVYMPHECRCPESQKNKSGPLELESQW